MDQLKVLVAEDYESTAFWGNPKKITAIVKPDESIIAQHYAKSHFYGCQVVVNQTTNNETTILVK